MANKVTLYELDKTSGEVKPLVLLRDQYINLHSNTLLFADKTVALSYALNDKDKDN